jgi:hypothetical protein
VERGLPFLKSSRLYVIWFSFTLFVLLPLHLASAGQSPAEIRSIQLVDGSGTNFVISANKQFQVYTFLLRNPDRLVIDCRQALLANSVSVPMIQTNPMVKRISLQPLSADELRITFDLKQQAEYSIWISGNDLRVRIATDAALRPSSDDRPVEMRISTLGNDNHISQTGKNSAKKSQVKMSGYTADQYPKNVVTPSDGASMGSAYGMSLRYRKKNSSSNGTFKIDYIGTGYDYNEPFVTDYMYQDFKLGYQWDLGSHWRVKTVGHIGFYDYGDLYGFRPEVAYRFDENNTFSFFGGNGTKVNYYDSGRTDQDRFVGVKYKTRLGNQTFILGYQRNFNDAIKARYDYVRSRYSLGYGVKWSKGARTMLKVDYSPRLYPSRFIRLQPEPDLEFGTLRQDQGLKFSMSSRIALSKHFELVPRYEYQMKSSNDPSAEDYSQFVSSISLRTRW